MLLDLLKMIIVGIVMIIILSFVWLYMRSVVGNVSMLGIINGQQLEITDEELWDPKSPLADTVRLDIFQGAKLSSPEEEYVRIVARRSNDSTIDMTGWSIHSMVSDTRIYIPKATLMLKMVKSGNSLQKVSLAPGEYAILKTGQSPISGYAQSFHTNRCTGYLNQFIDFNPKLPQQCPLPSSVLPATVENVRTYGGQCIEFLKSANRCTTYNNAMPANLLPACRDLISSKLTYNSCLSEEFAKDGYDIFNNGGWYLYLGMESEIWRNTYEALRLLDADGKVVDVQRY